MATQGLNTEAGMDLELVRFINSDLTWNAVKKGHRSMMRRPRKPGASSCQFGLSLGNKKQDSAVFDYEKSGVAVLGKHFAVEVLDVPIKKRILLLQSPSLNGAGALLPQPQTPSPDHEESVQLVGRKHDSGQWHHSNSQSNTQEMKLKNGSSNNELLKLTKKEVSDPNDFSGIELLAAAACDSSVCDGSDQVESFAVEKHSTPRVNSYTDGIKENIFPMDSDDSSVQDNPFPVMQNLCDNGNGEGDKRLVPSKGVRLRWDLNTVMDEWEEPCYDILVDPHSQKSYAEGFHNDGLQNAKANLESYEIRNSEVTGGEQETILHSVYANQPGKNDASISVGIQGNNEGDSFGKSYDVVEDITSSREVVGVITCKTSDAESCQSKSDVVDSFVHPTKCENFSKKSDDKQPVSLKGDGDGDDKLISEDRLSDCCGSNASQDERVHMAEGNTLEKAKAGYDSPFEDGELRDSIEYTWQKNEVEERDCVDYEYDNTYEDNFDTIESEKNEVTLDHDQPVGDESFLLENRSLGAVPNNDFEQGAKADASKEPNCLLGSKASGYQPQERSECADRAILEENDVTSRQFLKDGHDESRNLEGNLLCPDRSTSFGVRKNGTYIRQSRSDNFQDSYSRAKRDFGQEKFMGKDGLSYPSGQRDDSSMGARDLRNNNQAINYNPRGIYRTFNRRPSPSDRNESYGIHRGRTPPSRDVSRDRYKPGSVFHLQGLGRTPQEEYHDTERKVRCFSPNFNRTAHISRPRRRSRSRSGSPIAWHFQKKRNVDTKGETPDSRSDTRFPHASPQYISRSFDDRNVINGQVRDRRPSPMRTFQRNQKFEANGYLPRLKSTDHFRPSQRPARFPQHKFEDNINDSRIIRDDKYGMMNGGRRFRYPMDDSFTTRNPHNKDNGFRYTRNENMPFKDPVGRVVPKSTSEEKGCRYTINKMFTTALLDREGDFHKDDLQRE